MPSWKRKAILLLATSAALFGLFWVTAFSAEKVTDREAGEARISHSAIPEPTSMTKSVTIMEIDKTIGRGGESAS